MTKESWKPLSRDELNDWRQLWSDFPMEPFYKQISQNQLPASIPVSLREKINDAVVMTSGTPQGDVVMVCNLCRVDAKDAALDQQPFAIVFDSHGNSGSGVYLNHGDWHGRTSSPPPEFWDHVDKSGIGGYFYPVIPNGNPSGTLESISDTSHRVAFNEMVIRLKNHRLIERHNGESEQADL